MEESSSVFPSIPPQFLPIELPTSLATWLTYFCSHDHAVRHDDNSLVLMRSNIILTIKDKKS